MLGVLPVTRLMTHMTMTLWFVCRGEVIKHFACGLPIKRILQKMRQKTKTVGIYFTTVTKNHLQLIQLHTFSLIFKATSLGCWFSKALLCLCFSRLERKGARKRSREALWGGGHGSFSMLRQHFLSPI